MPLFEIAGVHKAFGGIRALNGVDLSITTTGTYGLIGPNGAGKTTLFDIITGLQAPEHGTITFDDRDITGWSAHRLHALGVVRTFQECRVFPEKTCLENMLFAVQKKPLAAAIGQAFWRSTAHLRAGVDEARRLLDLVRLSQYEDHPADALSFGQKRLLELATIYMRQPRLLLFDEPASGVNPALLDTLRTFILRMREEQDALLILVEHNMEFIMDVSDHIVVMHQGAVLEEGAPDTVQSSQRVIDAYLG
ncbi:MAG TPA: ABC transporter ATP-binding protein [Alphaproteobacteria bacterium]|nr:ABC transporter ATP-binding protein [Alphaproteobacteria bacterium]